MVKIYEIIDCNGLRYIGSTTQKYLCQRLAGHRSNKNCSSSKLDLDNCHINLLEECDKSVRKEREQYWLDKLKCINNRRSNGTDKERRRIYECNRQRYIVTWGGDSRWNNNLLQIDVNLFI
jgi:hypothetical protein